MGIEESTVREYRRRARIKLNISNLSEVASLLKDKEPTKLRQSNPRKTDRLLQSTIDAVVRRLPLAAASSIAACLVLTLLPPGWPPVTYQTVCPVICLGIAAGLVAQHALASPIIHPRIPPALLSLSAAGIAVIRLGLVFHGSMAIAVTIVLSIFTFLFSACAFQLLEQLSNKFTPPQKKALPTYFSFSVCGALFCGGLGKVSWIIGLTTAIICLLLCSRVNGATASPSVQPHIPMQWHIAYAAISTIWVVVWCADLRLFLTVILEIPTAIVAVASLLALRILTRGGFCNLISISSCIAVAAIVSGPRSALGVCTVLFYCIAATLRFNTDSTSQSVGSSMQTHQISVSFGLLLGILCVPLFESTVDSNPFTLSCLVALLALSSVLTSISCMSYSLNLQLNSRCLEATERQRVEGLLVYKGLTPTQALAVRRLFEGATVAEVSLEIRDTESAVRAARRKALTEFGSLTKAQLFREIRRSLDA